MRLVCPNCGARYEVPEQNIPASGRDVQCSACSMTWFQAPANFEKSQAGAAEEGIEKNEVARLPSNEHLPISDETEGDAINVVKLPKDENGKLPKHRLHPTLADVLKEEARREAAVRATEALNTQFNPGTKETITPDEVMQVDLEEGQAFRSKDRTLNAKTYEFDVVDINIEEKTKEPGNEIVFENENFHPSIHFGEKAQFKKSIDEISLPIRQRSRAKRLGFLAGLSIVVIFFLVYQQASIITKYLYVLDPFLERYVASVDRMRAISDQWFANGIYWIESRVLFTPENLEK